MSDYKIPEDVIEEVRIRSDIVDTIAEYVRLQRKGKNYLGLCPFHSEKTPSFTVTPDKQIFYCFGCHAGGNVFSFLMKKENWTFLETVEHLAHKNGVHLPQKDMSPREKEQQSRRRRWEEIHDWATGYFHDILMTKPEGEPGRQYFAKRGIDEQTQISFRLGYAPDRWDGLLQAMQARGVKAQELVEAGLALEREKSPERSRTSYYDRFRNRVIFAILDSRRRTIAFGGRVLDDSLPKYLNSPETAFFSKGHHVYGIHQAHQGIRQMGFALLAEGYMDVIALQKAGLLNSVASLGTALTRDQAKLLRRYCGRVVIVYDSDQAGIQATLRSGEILRDTGFRVDVLLLTGAKDPDEYINTHGVDSFKELLNQAEPYIQYKYRILAKNKVPRSAPEKRELVGELAPDIIKTQSPVEREGYERFLSLELGLTLEAIQGEILSKESLNPKNTREKANSPEIQDITVKNRNNTRCINSLSVPCGVHDGVYRAERILLRLLLEELIPPARIENELGRDFWKAPEHLQLFQSLESLGAGGTSGSSGEGTVGMDSQAARLLLEEMDLTKPEQLYKDCLRQITWAQQENTVEELQSRMLELEKSGDVLGAMALLKEIGERLKSG